MTPFYFVFWGFLAFGVCWFTFIATKVITTDIQKASGDLCDTVAQVRRTIGDGNFHLSNLQPIQKDLGAIRVRACPPPPEPPPKLSADEKMDALVKRCDAFEEYCRVMIKKEFEAIGQTEPTTGVRAGSMVAEVGDVQRFTDAVTSLQSAVASVAEGTAANAQALEWIVKFVKHANPSASGV